MSITTNRRGLGMVAAFALLLAACGSDVAAPATTIATAAEPATTVAETTTTMPQTEPTTATTTPATVSADDDGVTVIKDIVYLEMNRNEYLLHVYAPDGDGPWPVVIALHGIPATKGHPTNTAVAKAAAEAVMLVFAPNWVAELPQPTAMDAAWMRSEDPAMPCALALPNRKQLGTAARRADCRPRLLGGCHGRSSVRAWPNSRPAVGMPGPDTTDGAGRCSPW